MARANISRIPSPYNPLYFHLLRLGQFCSGSIVASVVNYFVYFLKAEHYELPWTFIFLLAASVITLLAIIASSTLYYFHTLPPKHNLTINASLSVLWILGLGFVTQNLGWTLGHRCTILTWHTEAGVMVCRLYKACTAFTVTGLLTTLLALFLDIQVYRRSTSLGKYNAMYDPDIKRSNPAISSPVPQIELSHTGRRNDTGDLGDYALREEIEVQRFGYQAPTEQTQYDPGHGKF